VRAVSNGAVRSGWSAPDRRLVVRRDGSTPVPGGSRAGSAGRSTAAGRDGLEVAQRVWQRSLELAGTGRHRLPDHALALARMAGHDPDTMTHALGLGRSQAGHPSTGENVRGGVQLLERAITYLGGRADLGEIATTERRHDSIPRAVALSDPRAGQHSSTGRRPEDAAHPGRPQPSPHEETTMPSSVETWMGDDDLSRQRRKREQRLLDGEVPDFPGLTVADIVADVLAASDDGHAAFEVPTYLVERGYTSTTITTVVAYLQRQRPSHRAASDVGRHPT
jgi:hypothetical protein